MDELSNSEISTAGSTEKDEKFFIDSSSTMRNSLKKQEFFFKELKEKYRKYDNSIAANKKNGISPLSLYQQQLWFISSHDKSASRAYHESIIFRIKGDLHNLVLKDSFEKVVRRHEILSSTFLVGDDGAAFQKTDLSLPVRFEEMDFSTCELTFDKNKLSKDFINNYIEKPFKFECENLIRAALLKIEDGYYVFILVMHHMVMDGWSVDVITREISELYNSSVEHRANTLISLPIQYSDFAFWQQQHFQGEYLEKLTSYWKSQLHDVQNLELPTDRARPILQSYAGKWLSFSISKDVAERLELLGRKSRCTLFVTLLSIYKVLLHRYTQQKDICIGTPVANRLRSEVKNLVGFFANVIALKTTINSNDSFYDVLATVKSSILGSYEYQGLPFENVVAAVQPRRSNNISPIFQLLFVFNNSDTLEFDLANLEVKTEYPECTTSKFDITLSLQKLSTGELRGGFEYSTDLFDESTIQRISSHFVELADLLSSAPDTVIGEIDFLSAQEMRQLLVKWNNTAAPYPATRCIHEFFEIQVVSAPHSVAVVFNEQYLTYGELNARANLLAHYLIEQRNVKPDTLVGICAERSLDMVIAIIAILKAGGAYVPLDPDYPQLRLQNIVKDASLDTVILQRHLDGRIDLEKGAAIYIDDAELQITLSKLSAENIAPSSIALTPSNLAYVIYTSGSTGNPKGVMIEHTALVNRIDWMGAQYGASPSDKILQKTPFSFDVSVWEFMWPLTSGATIVLAKPGGHKDPVYLSALIEDQKITKLHFVPSMLGSMLADGDLSRADSLRQVFCSGEMLPLAFVKEFQARCIGVEIHNLYGPTEAAIDVSYWDCSQAYGDLSGAPIGRPIKNIQLLILDRHQKITPIGMVGELHIGGIGLARGYLNRPELTAEKFIPNPFYNSTYFTGSKRLYKTGDLCRYLPDGNIEFLGRIDHQVKIRGFRIETGEVESALISHELVRGAAVLVCESAAGDKQLVAFVASAHTISPVTLKEYLRKLLPDYMVPSVYVVIDELPLTTSGKIDRKALESISVVPHASAFYTPPRTKLEYQVTEIWSALLHRDIGTIGIYDNFFELGGHSLLVIRAVIQIKEKLKRNIGVRDFFESPTINGLAAILDGLLPEYQLPAIEILGSREQVVTSYAQERLWFLEQLEEGSSSYLVPMIYRLKGRLNVSSLQYAYECLLSRHEILRTCISVTEQGIPCQVIKPTVANRLKLYSLTSTNKNSDFEFIINKDEFLNKFINNPFNLADENLIRIALIEHSTEEYTLAIVMHHIITDGWSVGVLMQELSMLYADCNNGLENQLAPLAVQYADYSAWQRKYLQGDILDKQSVYWQQQLQNISILKLPSDRPRPPMQSYRGAWLPLDVPQDIARRLKKTGQSQGCSSFMALLAVFNVLLYRYAQQNTLCVGTPIANRLQSEVEPLIGLFVNTLALRTEIDNTKTFTTLLQQIKETTLTAYENQLIPFEKVVEVVQPERSQAYSPLFQAMLVLQIAQDSVFKLSDIEVISEEAAIRKSKFDLTLSLTEMQDGSFSGGIEYATDLFDKSTIKRMATHFIELANALPSAPDKKINEFTLLTAAEQHQLLVDWNKTDAVYPEEKCIHELFEEQVEKTPDAIAVIFNDQTLTYRSLNNKANQFARYLIGQGVRPDQLIGICIERSLDMVIGLLAILKAGGAYVPLDPGYPKARLEYMFEDAGLNIVLTQSSLAEKARADRRNVICLDDKTIQEKISKLHVGNLVKNDLGLSSSNLAYVIYTSGSTGNPKGVMISHQGPVNLYIWYAQHVFSQPAEKVLLLGSLSFDLTQKNIFSTLSFGHMLIIPDMDIFDPSLVFTIANFHKVTTINCAPSIWSSLENASRSTLENLKQLVLGGESLDKFNAQDFFKKNPDANLYNSYGPTECSDVTTFYKVKPENTLKDVIPIGKGVANTKHYILDINGQPVPVGVTGELYIGGVGLARGYLNRPELTTEKFVFNPFSDALNDRLYKTGDLCRYLANGDIQYIGRIDDQVKIRGLRIELGEIESALTKYIGIDDAVVLAKHHEDGSAFLAAYIVCDRALSILELRDFLQNHIPDYMIPGIFKILSALPLTPNGKVDRSALSSLDIGKIDSTQKYVAPESDIQKKLARIWANILNLEEIEIGIEHNFFLLGGHSLLAGQVVAQIRSQFKWDISIRTLFEKPTIRALSNMLSRDSQEDFLPSIQPLVERAKLPLSFAQERLWFLNQFEEGKSTYLIPAFYRLTGALNVGALQQAYDSMLERHEILRAKIITDSDGRPYQTAQLSKQNSLPIYSLLSDGISEPNRIIADYSLWINDFTHRPFNLNEGNLVRSALIEVDKEHYILAIIFHHIITDGWSMKIFMDELSCLYHAYCHNGKNPLPELPIQYADYAAWQRDYLKGEIFERQLAYWRSALQGLVLLELPIDRPRPALQSYKGSWLSFEIPVAIAQPLKMLGQSQDCTLFMTLLAAYKVLLNRYTQQRAICVGTPIANRLEKDVESLIGLFVNTLALRTDIDSSCRFIDLLKIIREVTLSAYEYQMIPFEKIVEAIQPERSQAHSPLFQTMFTLQNTQEASLNLDSINLTVEHAEWKTSMFDLTLSLIEMPNGSLAGGFEYATDLFDRETISRFINHYIELCKSIVVEPTQRLYELNILTESEKYQLSVAWNDTAAFYPKEKCIHELFEEQVEKAPDATALTFNEQNLTYQELNEKANQLAHYLISQGVGPETLVGICIERSLEMVIGLLGVLKAGGAYVPLDPGYPKARLEYMLEDAALTIVITQSHLVGLLDDKKTAICIDNEILQRDFLSLPSNNIDPRESGLTSKNLAYVIYTSGSTGNPKGVLIQHSSLVNLATSISKIYTLNPADKLLQLATINFDISVEDIFSTLISGANLVIADKLWITNSENFWNLCELNKITVLDLPTAFWHNLLLSTPSIPDCIRHLSVGGEKIKQEALNDWFSKVSATTTLCNMYGPTECTVDSTFAFLSNGDGHLGRPLPNYQIYILDAHGNQMPVGVWGELHIGGVGLARGYLNRPESTAEKFISNPFFDPINSASSEKLYKTGDLCRYLPSGDVEFLGRIDHQVKVRGFRIELGEIESALAKHELVKDAVVIVREGAAGDKQLIAFVVSLEEVKSTALKKYLDNLLPEYMVPAIFSVRDSLPLTPNGKVDRKALELLPLELTLDEHLAKPKNQLEQQLAEIWSRLLNWDENSIGRQDNFFELGGHSLLVMVLLSDIQKTFSINCNVIQIYKNKFFFEQINLIESIIKKVEH